MKSWLEWLVWLQIIVGLLVLAVYQFMKLTHTSHALSFFNF